MATALRTLFILFLAAVVALMSWYLSRDPIDMLPSASQKAVLVEKDTERRDGRLLFHYVLKEPKLGQISLAISLPDPLPDHSLPIVIVLGGLGTGKKSIQHVRAAGDNAIVGYDWPIDRDLSRGVELPWQLYQSYRRLLNVPGQVAAGIDWIAEQPWADSERISLLGFSLGSLAVPAVQRLAGEAGYRIGWTVVAYGGAPLGDVLAAHPQLTPHWIKPAVRRVGNLILRPVEPAEHLPHLSGQFLVIASRDDRLIPEDASVRFQTLTPEPKTVVVLDSDHIGTGPDQTSVVDEITQVSRYWLIGHKAVNPPDSPL